MVRVLLSELYWLRPNPAKRGKLLFNIRIIFVGLVLRISRICSTRIASPSISTMPRLIADKLHHICLMTIRSIVYSNIWPVLILSLIHIFTVPKDKSFQGELDFRNSGHAEIWEPLTGNVIPAIYEKKGDRTSVKISLPQAGSYFVVFRKDNPEIPAKSAVAKKVITTIPLSQPWELKFPDGWGAVSYTHLNRINGTTFTNINAAFFKLKNAEIGYTLPASARGKIGVANARIYLSGTNLFSIDHMRGMGIDPEATGSGYGGWALNPQRLINLGVNISF